jgi:ADP-heptose:LPS heptosyltransferase
MNWQGCKKILCIRPDNMGDVIMTVPAIRALKETFGARITPAYLIHGKRRCKVYTRN